MSAEIKKELKRILNGYRKTNQITYVQYCKAYKVTVRYLIARNIKNKCDMRSKLKNMLIYMLAEGVRELNEKLNPTMKNEIVEEYSVTAQRDVNGRPSDEI